MCEYVNNCVSTILYKLINLNISWKKLISFLYIRKIVLAPNSETNDFLLLFLFSFLSKNFFKKKKILIEIFFSQNRNFSFFWDKNISRDFALYFLIQNCFFLSFQTHWSFDKDFVFLFVLEDWSWHDRIQWKRSSTI